jgi:hypothetical protein
VRHGRSSFYKRPELWRLAARALVLAERDDRFHDALAIALDLDVPLLDPTTTLHRFEQVLLVQAALEGGRFRVQMDGLVSANVTPFKK